MEIRTLELGKLPGAGESGREEALLGWLRLIRSEESEEIEMLAARSPEMGEAVTILKELSADERARLVFEAREKARMDELARLYGARAEGEAKGRAEGLAEGMNKGRAEGLAEGMNKGKAEMAKSMAKALLSKNIPPEVIAESSGLSLNEIEALSRSD
jgi:predicted transposase/invertase (TIGR01784 family)